MKIMKHGVEVVAKSEDGGTLRLQYTNRGEPYREGLEVQIMLQEDEWTPSTAIFLDQSELIRFRDALNKLLGD